MLAVKAPEQVVCVPQPGDVTGSSESRSIRSLVLNCEQSFIYGGNWQLNVLQVEPDHQQGFGRHRSQIRFSLLGCTNKMNSTMRRFFSGNLLKQSESLLSCWYIHRNSCQNTSFCLFSPLSDWSFILGRVSWASEVVYLFWWLRQVTKCSVLFCILQHSSLFSHVIRINHFGTLVT